MAKVQPVKVEVGLDLSGVQQIGVAKPGDTVIVTFGRRLHQDEFDEMRNMFMERYPELKLLAFDGGTEVTIMRREVHDDGN